MSFQHKNGGEIDEFHRHELLDRIHCVGVMFDELVASHTAAELIKSDIAGVSEKLAALYQRAGEVRFHE